MPKLNISSSSIYLPKIQTPPSVNIIQHLHLLNGETVWTFAVLDLIATKLMIH